MIQGLHNDGQESGVSIRVEKETKGRTNQDSTMPVQGIRFHRREEKRRNGWVDK